MRSVIHLVLVVCLVALCQACSRRFTSDTQPPSAPEATHPKFPDVDRHNHTHHNDSREEDSLENGFIPVRKGHKSSEEKDSHERRRPGPHGRHESSEESPEDGSGSGEEVDVTTEAPREKRHARARGGRPGRRLGFGRQRGRKPSSEEESSEGESHEHRRPRPPHRPRNCSDDSSDSHEHRHPHRRPHNCTAEVTTPAPEEGSGGSGDEQTDDTVVNPIEKRDTRRRGNVKHGRFQGDKPGRRVQFGLKENKTRSSEESSESSESESHEHRGPPRRPHDSSEEMTTTTPEEGSGGSGAEETDDTVVTPIEKRDTRRRGPFNGQRPGRRLRGRKQSSEEESSDSESHEHRGPPRRPHDSSEEMTTSIPEGSGGSGDELPEQPSSGTVVEAILP